MFHKWAGPSVSRRRGSAPIVGREEIDADQLGFTRAGLRLAPRRSRSAPRLALLTSHASHHRVGPRLGGPASDGRNVALSSAASKASAVTHRIASPLAAVALPAVSTPAGRH